MKTNTNKKVKKEKGFFITLCRMCSDKKAEYECNCTIRVCGKCSNNGNDCPDDDGIIHEFRPL